MKLGIHIAALRKSKGMTQEQLATAVGVSAPAVSKWETEASCPDISLLCPIARALGTNVDKLLQFEEVLSKDELTQKMNEIVETARNGNVDNAESMLNNLLHTYPTDCELKYYAYMTIHLFAILLPMKSAEKQEIWEAQQKQLLEEIRLEGALSYQQKAVSALAGLAIRNNELEQAEQLLHELQEHTEDTKMLWAQFYLKKNEPEKALEVTQRHLFALVGKIQNCFISMMNKEMVPSAEQTLEIGKVYRQVQEIFMFPNSMSEGFFMEAYMRMGKKEEVKKSAIKMIYDNIDAVVPNPNPVLFHPTFKVEQGKAAVTREMKELLLQGLMNDEALADYQQDEEFRIAIEKLQQDIRNCER